MGDVLVGDRLAGLVELLRREESEGFRDVSVEGGLDRYLIGWVRSVVDSVSGQPQREALTAVANLLVGYSRATVTERQSHVRKALLLLNELSVASPPNVSEKALQRSLRQLEALDVSVTRLRGIDKAQAAKLARLGVQTIGDLLYLFPRRYVDYSQLKRISELTPGALETVIGTIWEIHRRRTRSQRTLITALVGDDSGTLEVVWFRAGREYFTEQFRVGQIVALSGRVEARLGQKVLVSPEWELLTAELVHTGRVVPVYPLTEGLSGRWLRRHLKQVVDVWARQIPDFLPTPVKQEAMLIDRGRALAQVHFPEEWALLRQAQRRLAYDELFLLQTSLLMQREAYRRSQKGNPMPLVGSALDAFVNSLPFSLTKAQRRAVEEILGDMAEERPMARLLQGEVGSGKTVVAAIAALAAMANGFQVAVMAPTEILAEQHARTFTDLYAGVSTEGFPIESRRLDGRPSVVLITGSLGSGEKEHRREQIANGQAQVIIGTHALIEEAVAFQRLGLVVVDEQHRFGVLQRAILRQKGYNPHVLVMTATPIPRTMALTVYSDLDLSVIAEKPPGRPEVRTRVLDTQRRERAYQFVHQRLTAGEQGFIVCPLIEESEKLEAKAATAEYQRLSAEVFPDLRLGLLHGRMKAAEKDQAMLAFRERQFDLLVCTTVIEVGIDIPNATIMMVEGADRFGLAQLHQLRGRVGRGERPGYCLLVAESPSGEAQERLKMLERSDDGFQLAEWDLKLRGPGEFFGTRQSGLPELRIANIEDLALAEETRRAALQILDEDPDLERSEHLLLAREVRRLRARLEELS